MNLPNRLTLARLVLCAFFVLFLTLEFPYSRTIALVVFLIATFTDWLDGYLARRYNLVTDFGKLMDPLADKILTAAAFILLVNLHIFPAWAAIVIISREFLITGLRLLATAKGRVLPAETLGKHKTLWQMIAILHLLALLALRDFLPPVSPVIHVFGSPWLTFPLVSIAVVLTAWSGLGYLYRNRDLISEA